MMVSANNDRRRDGTIWVLNLALPTPAVTPHISATFFCVDPQFASELEDVVDGEVRAEVHKRFETGRRCYAARVDGKIAAYAWVSFDEELIGELSLRLRLGTAEAYIWDCVTLPAFRRRYLYSAILSHIAAELRKEKFSRVWIGADSDNIPSRRGIARAGFSYVADLIVARVLTLRQVWVQGRPDVSDGVLAEARRVFLNDRDDVWLNANSLAAKAIKR